MEQSAPETIGYLEATSIGIGGMVGGGIFAVLGLAVQLTKGGTPVGFAIAGVVALVTSYAYTRLSVTFPSQGGTVSFLDRAYGSGLFAGTMNILLWISYVLMLALYAYAFGSYSAQLFPADVRTVAKHAMLSSVVVAITGLNLLSARAVGAAEDWIVAIKLAILLLFVGAGIWGVQPARLAPAAWASPTRLVAGGMIIFVAYEGFELIANAAEDVRQPAKTLPRAFYSAVGVVIALYVLIAAVATGNLSLGQIVQAKDYALAAAARPFLGRAGYLLITVAALLSTTSAINATLYGAARLSYIIAKDGELPEELERKVWNEPIEGLVITAVLTLLVANLFDLSSLSTLGSAGFLLIFAAVNGANVLLARESHSHRWISIAGLVLCLSALASLLWQTASTAPSKLWVLGAMVSLALTIEALFRFVKKRTLTLRSSATGADDETGPASGA